MNTHAVLYGNRKTGELVELRTEPMSAAEATRLAHRLCKGGYARVVLVDRTAKGATQRFDSAAVH